MRSSTSSTGGSNPCCTASPHIPEELGTEFILATIALVLAVFAIVVAHAWYRNGLDAEGHDPTVERLGPFAKVLENAYYLDVGWARVRERSAHHVRPVPE